MTISDADYLAWLADTDARRIVLAEVQCYPSTSVATQYLATGPYVSAPTDSPANTAYDDIIKAIPLMQYRLSEAFTGRSSISAGDMLIDNSGGERDAWLTYGWDGRPVTLYLGSPDWAKADFRKILVGVVADIAAPDVATLSLRLRDKQALLNVQVQTQDGFAGAAAIPLCFGHCFNVTPVLTDAGTSTYQVHNGPIDAIYAVRDNGIELAYPAGYSVDLANGKFSLAAAPVGQITSDVRGAAPGGTYIETVADIIEHLITTYSSLTSADLDADAFAAMNTTCPQRVGLYVSERANLLDVLDQLVVSVGGWYAFDRAGLLQIGRFDTVSQASPWAENPVLYVTDDDVAFRSLRLRSRELPAASMRLGYAPNWTVQPNVAAAVVESERALFAAPESAYGYGRSWYYQKHLLPADLPALSTLLAVAYEASAEGTRRFGMTGDVRSIYEATFFAAPFQVNLGKLIHLTHPRFGFAGGLLARVIAIKEDPLRGRCELELWL